jgi:hypothetical protein
MGSGSVVRVGAATLAVGLALAACSSGSSGPASTPSSSGSAGGKSWVVDTSGWWVPSDPTGCGTDTVTCTMAADKVRAYRKGNTLFNVFVHGDTITLLCKAPTPAAIRNSVKTESKYWYYAAFKDQHYWVPDVYVTKDAVDAMAQGVTDCPSDTPGING